jgi:[ribosomal protein S18]-alanine N-acetyltransferase
MTDPAESTNHEPKFDPAGTGAFAADLAGGDIRPMRAGDLTDVVRLERICFGDPWSVLAFSEEIRRGPAAMNRVLRLEGRLVGYTVAWYVAGEVHLANLAVDPAFRGRGAATALLRDLLREGERRHASVVWLEVRLGNAAAIRLYEKFGFRTVSVRKNYYAKEREDALVMSRSLSPAGEEGSADGSVRREEGRIAREP